MICDAIAYGQRTGETRTLGQSGLSRFEVYTDKGRLALTVTWLVTGGIMAIRALI